MSWARIDDGYYDHPKIVAAGNAAVGLHARSLAYCAKHATDGVLPRELVTVILGDSDGALASRLVAVGLFSETPAGYQLHDFLDYNPSSVQVKRERRSARLRMRRFRSGSAPVHPNGNGEVRVNGDGAVPGRDGKGSSPASSQEPTDARTKTAPRARAWKTLPPGEELTQGRCAFGVTEGLSLEAVAREWAAFADHEFVRSHVDVDKTWRRWVREALRRASNGNGNGPQVAGRRWTSSKTAGNVAAGQEAIRRIREAG